MQVYLCECECFSFYLATANQRDVAKRNRAGAWRIEQSYCATAPDVKMAALQVALVILLVGWYNNYD